MVGIFTGDPLHSRAACTQPCNVNTHSRAHCSPGARLCEQWGHGCVNNGARLCASARLCRGSPVILPMPQSVNASLSIGSLGTNFGEILIKINKRSENDNTPQLLNQWTDSPFMGQQIGNWTICHALWAKRKPIGHPTLYPTHISFIPSQSTFPFPKNGY